MALPLIRAPHLERIPGLIHGFTTRNGGVSQGPFESLNLGWATGDDDDLVSENYQILAKDLGQAGDRLVGVRQMHGGEVAVLTDANAGTIAGENADALITATAGFILTARVADCFPVLIVDPQRRAVGIAHAGWRGTLARVVPNTLAQMKAAFGVEPNTVYVAIGPGIGKCCFEVSDAIGELFRVQIGLEPKEVKEAGIKAFLDLSAINSRLALAAGVRPDRMWISGECTQCKSDTYFSYRRDGKKSGRMLGFIGWSS